MQHLDPNTGLALDGHRCYDPTTGKWITEDPIGFKGGDPNVDRYAENRVTQAVDPSGLQAQKGYNPLAGNPLYELQEAIFSPIVNFLGPPDLHKIAQAQAMQQAKIQAIQQQMAYWQQMSLLIPTPLGATVHFHSNSGAYGGCAAGFLAGAIAGGMGGYVAGAVLIPALISTLPAGMTIGTVVLVGAGLGALTGELVGGLLGGAQEGFGAGFWTAATSEAVWGPSFVIGALIPSFIYTLPVI